MADVICALLNDEYYQTVPYGFIEDAIERSLEDNGGKPFATLDDLDRHIRANYI